MSSLSIVVEGRLDVVLLRKYLPAPADIDLRFFVGEGQVSLPTLARNLLVHEPGAVLMVMDGATLDPARAQQNRAMALAALRQMSASTRFDAFVFVPEHEVVFFEAPQVMHRYWDKSVLSSSVLERGRYAPKDTLEGLLKSTGQGRASWFSKLTLEDGGELRKGAQAAGLVTMLHSLCEAEMLEKSA